MPLASANCTGYWRRAAGCCSRCRCRTRRPRSSAGASATGKCSTCCRPRTTATGCAAPARYWRTATTATTCPAGCARPVSPRPACGRRRAISSATCAGCWSRAAESFDHVDALFLPGLDAAVAAVQAQPQPVRAGRARRQFDHRPVADPRVCGVGGNLPELGDVRRLAPVLGARHGHAVDGDLDPLDADPVLERPAADFEAAPDLRTGQWRVDPAHPRQGAVALGALAPEHEQQEALAAMVGRDR